MLFKPETRLYGYEIKREAKQDILYVNYMGSPNVPDIGDSAIVMARTADYLLEVQSASKVVFVQQRNYSYPQNQVAMLMEIAQIYEKLIKQEKVLVMNSLAPYTCKRCVAQRYGVMRYLVLTLLKQDPIACYMEARRIYQEEKANPKNFVPECTACETGYLKLLAKIILMLQKTQIIKEATPKLGAYKLRSRDFYKEIFRPEIIPNFTYTRLISSLPTDAEIIDEYQIGNEFDQSTVTILKVPNQTKYLYHINAPEFTLNEDLQSLVNLARNVLLEHKPKAEEFTDPSRIRQVFFNIAKDLLQELSNARKLALNFKQINKLATILVRQTIGFGLIEVLLQDDKLQDIMVNSPAGLVPIFVRHGDYDECDTNIMPSQEDTDSWAAKFRMMSGRPLDEANAVLDTELIIENARARVAIIQQH